MDRLEELTVALNRELYAEAAGLDSDASKIANRVGQLTAEYRPLLSEPASRDMALDGMAGAQDAHWAQLLSDKRQAALVCPEITVGGEIVTWHNWKRTERELSDTQSLQLLLASFVERSHAPTSTIIGRYRDRRRLYAQYGTTPLVAFARRE
jgi:hypothetical protein